MKQTIIAAILISLLLTPILARDDVVLAQRQVEKIKAEVENQINEATPSPLLKSDTKEEINYTLPYPGILPDHPLYSLKTLRDRILELLIRDPLRKAEFYLLMADKRLNMGIYLTNKEKFSLAESTVAQGETYFLKGVDFLERINSSEKSAVLQTVLNKFRTADLKHKEAINNLKIKSPDNTKKGYSDSLKSLDKIQEKLKKMGNE